MSRLPHLPIFIFAAAVHLLLFSICPVSSRIYRTNDAVVIEVDDVRPISTFANRNSGNPPLVSMAYEINPYTGLYYQQQPNLPFWPYPLYKPASSFSDFEKVTSTSADSRQQNIPCGVGPDSPPQRKTPTVGIIGGSNATANSWPFIVGLKIADGSSNVRCGGSIISPTRILTAAHCVIQLSALDISQMTVSLGMHTQGHLPDTVNDAQMTRRVSRVVYHANYNSKTKVNDIAILTMDPPINYSKAISPVCLPPFNNAADQFVGKDAAIMGWGRLVPGGSQPNALQQATVKIIGRAKCNQLIWGSSVNPVFNQQICAGADGEDTCQGDSGGPMVAQTKAGSTAWTQVGVTSFGFRCSALSTIPSVYASVAFFRNWIDNYMKN